MLRCNYTVDYVDAVILDERSSLAVPAIHAFLKTFFPKLASHVLTEQTCSIIDNLVTTLSSMVEVVDLQTSALRLIGDLRALSIVYSSGAELKAPVSLQPALENLLTRIKTTRDMIKEGKQPPQQQQQTQQQQQLEQLEAPKKKPRFMIPMPDDEEDDDYDTPLKSSSEQPTAEEEQKPSSSDKTILDQSTCSSSESAAQSSESKKEEVDALAIEDQKEEKMDSDKPSESDKTEDQQKPEAKSSTSLNTPAGNSSQQNSLVNNLDTLEKTVVSLQMILQFHTKNN